jgi:hypothetical protein
VTKLMECTAKPARTSLIYHLGLEGLGELALDNEPDEDVGGETMAWC